MDLKLPPSIDDLIPSSTTIQTQVLQIDDNGEFSSDSPLVYYISFKQLQRLRKVNSNITLSICQNDTLDKLIFSMSDAKEVVYNQTSKKLDQIYQFVSDKGHWYKVIGQQKELKIGLFYVQMPDNNNSSSNNSVAGSFIHIRSPPPLPSNKLSFRKKKNLTSILGNNSTSISSMTTPSIVTTTTATTAASSLTLEKPPLRRAKSSLVDLNIEELSDVLKKLNVFSAPPPTPTGSPEDKRPYHQIGKGTSKYTFYFRIIHVDHHNYRRIKKPFLSYTFLTKYTLLPTASFSSTRKSMPTTPSSHHYSLNATFEEPNHCFYLRGHLVDIQAWLEHQQYIQLNYILMDSRTKEMIGQHNVQLDNIAYDHKGLIDKTISMMNADKQLIATITFKIGLVSGWLDEQQKDTSIPGDKRNNHLLLNQHKKMKQYSVIPDTPTPTSTNSSSRRSSLMPSIRYIHPRRPKSIIPNI